MNWTVGRLLRWSTEYLAVKGIDSSRLDSEVLLSSILNIDRPKIYLDIHRPLSLNEFKRYKKLIKRRALREPIHYILGFREFWSLSFKVNQNVLIPRPETEILIQKTFDILKTHFPKRKGLVCINDIGTGCGNIAISLSKERDNLYLIATDNSEKALAIASENALLNNIDNKICFQNRDLFGKLKINHHSNKKFDVIVSNPPYIPTDEINTLDPEIKNYEPADALDGGPDGLDFYRKIIAGIPKYLIKRGFVIFEMGFNQGKAISELLKNARCFSEIEITEDYSGNNRVISAMFTGKS